MRSVLVLLVLLGVELPSVELPSVEAAASAAASRSACTLVVQSPAEPAASTAQQSDADAQREKRRAELAAAMVALEGELAAAQGKFQLELAAARQRNVPAAEMPKAPEAALYPRFEKLATEGDPRAAWWCLTRVSSIGLALEATLLKKFELFDVMVRKLPDEPYMTDVAQFIRNDASPGGIGADNALFLLTELEKNSRVPETRAAAVFGVASVYERVNDLPAMRKCYEELVQKYPATAAGRQARARLFQLDELKVGKAVPDFTTHDVDGVEFKLSDYRGKVVVLDFWGFW